MSRETEILTHQAKDVCLIVPGLIFPISVQKALRFGSVNNGVVFVFVKDGVSVPIKICEWFVIAKFQPVFLAIIVCNMEPRTLPVLRKLVQKYTYNF